MYYLTGERGVWGLLEVCNKTVGSNSFKLLQKRSWLNDRKIFFTVRVVKHWSRFLGEAVGSLALKT